MIFRERERENPLQLEILVHKEMHDLKSLK